jgi:starch-binding outer membrane protein, SusD/RagB family
MKKYSKTIILAFMGISMLSTSCNDVFNELAVNPNQQDVSSFYNTPENINKGVLGVYAYVTTPRAMGVSAFRIMANRGGRIQ